LKYEEIVINYYQKIFNYCYAKTGNYQIAEDCTQETFLILYKKMDKLKLSTNVLAWLYKAASLEIKNYLRKNKETIPLESISETEIESSPEPKFLEDIITDDEYELLSEYYISQKDINNLADERKISKMALYQRIQRIKNKILKNKDKLHNLLNK
jgi:RNA polymerase sigma-70 factor (ECF subfamily)